MNNSFLKWAGGKNWFIKHQSHRLPQQYNRYIEPFLGGGSVFFYLEPEEALLSDINEELIATYQAIQTDWRELDRQLRSHSRRHNDMYYYEVRKKRPRKLSNVAARMIYLNRTCFNGIYRVNRKGEFNVPKGSKDSVLLEQDDFERRSRILQNAVIRCCDFERSIDEAVEGDFLYCDPPYAIKEEKSFVEYTKNTFDWNDQIRLANALKRAAGRNVKVLMTNVNHSSVKELYRPSDGFVLDEVSRYSSISGKSGGRKQYSELIVSANI